ncbi:MAG: cytochrome c [Candidatus Latescibacterota bacterium]
MSTARCVAWRVGLGVLAALALCCGHESAPARHPSGSQLPGAGVRAAALNEVERGRLVYKKYGCAMCHGPEGQGGVENPNAQTGGEIPQLIYVAEGYTTAELGARIRGGVWEIARADSSGPTPPYRMPSMGTWMSAGEVDALVEYLRSLMPEGAEEEW